MTPIRQVPGFENEEKPAVETVTITISREDAEDVLMTEYGCSECGGPKEILLSALRAVLEGER